MHITRRAEVVVQTAAIAWASLLAMAGLWLLASSSVLPLPKPVLFFAGIGLLAAAQFLCMALVADHLFPQVHPGLRLAGEATSFVIFLAGLVLAAWFLIVS